jgi:CheY-like chemotaxis protein
LPVCDAGTELCTAAESTDSSVCVKRRVLVVDDNVDAADSTAALLQLMGHEVCEALDGLQSVAAAEAFRPEVILMDIGMPALDGREAARRIRQLALSPSPLIVSLTGWDCRRKELSTDERLFDFNLVKPVDARTLARTLRELTDA